MLSDESTQAAHLAHDLKYWQSASSPCSHKIHSKILDILLDDRNSSTGALPQLGPDCEPRVRTHAMVKGVIEGSLPSTCQIPLDLLIEVPHCTLRLPQQRKRVSAHYDLTINVNDPSLAADKS